MAPAVHGTIGVSVGQYPGNPRLRCSETALPPGRSSQPTVVAILAFPAESHVFRGKFHVFRGKILHFPRGNHLRTPLSLILSGATDPRFQGETSSVPHEEREHGYQKGRSEGSRETRRREEGWAEEGGC